MEIEILKTRFEKIIREKTSHGKEQFILSNKEKEILIGNYYNSWDEEAKEFFYADVGSLFTSGHMFKKRFRKLESAVRWALKNCKERN